MSHGLSQGVPLTVESIIRGCFSNPRRKDHPEFMNKIWGNYTKIYNQNETPDHWINLLKPELIQKFNSSKITLHDTSKFKSDYIADKEPYLQAIRTQSWHGPYTYDSLDWFYFVSINQSGDNIYFVYLGLDLSSPPTQYLQLLYCNNGYIAPPHVFILK